MSLVRHDNEPQIEIGRLEYPAVNQRIAAARYIVFTPFSTLSVLSSIDHIVNLIKRGRKVYG